MMAHALPEGWSIKALGDPSVALINPPEKLPKVDTYPFIPMDAVEDKFGGVKYIETIKEASGGYTRFRDGDILFAKITPCVENGKVARISGLNGALGLGSTEFHAIRPAENTDGDYLYYLMSSGAVHGLAVSLMEGTTGRQRIPASIFKRRLAVPMPSNREEQRRIAAVLCKVDETIAKKQASIAAAQKLKRGLMQNLLTGKLKPDGTWRRDNEFEIDPKFGRVPKGWQLSKLKNIAEIKRGRFSYRPRNEPRFFGGAYPFIQTAEIVASDRLITNHTQTLSEEGRAISRKFPPGTIMITIAANIGETAITIYDVYATDSVIGIVPHDDISPGFLEYSLRLWKTHLNAVATESAQKNINYGNLRPLLIVHPITKADQNAVIAPLLELEGLIRHRENKKDALLRLKKSLMQNLLTGKVRIPPDLKID